MNRNLSTQVPIQSPQFEQPAALLPFQQQSQQPTPPLQSQYSISNVATRIGDRETGFFGWWYHFTCPKVSPEVAKSLEGREKIRKARLASLTLLVLCGFVLLPMPVALISNNMPLFVVLLVTLAFYGIAIFCTRKNNLALAGFLTILVLELGLVSFFMTVPGGLSIKELPVFDISRWPSFDLGACLL